MLNWRQLGSVRFVIILIIAFIICFCNPASTLAINASYTYDRAGRLTMVKYGSNSITYKYDKAGNLLQKVIKKGSMILMIVPVISAGANK